MMMTMRSDEIGVGEFAVESLESPALTKDSICKDRRLKQSQKFATSRAHLTHTSHW